jgi:two-component system NtrC family sensor kinase
MRTLSARILLGFAALTIAFGVITATVVVNMREVENEVELIGNNYTQLTLRAKDLARSEDTLREYVDKRIRDEPTIRIAQGTLKRLRDARDQVLNQLKKSAEGLDELLYVDPTMITSMQPLVEDLHAMVEASAPLYRTVIESPPVGTADDDDPKQQAARAAYQDLRRSEGSIKVKTDSVASELERKTRQRTQQLQENEHTVRLRTIYLGIVAVTLGLLITMWVVITLRPLRRLRDGARRVAAGDYGNRIAETGPAEVSDLAREFNAMGRAVQERERELVRSERLAAVGKMAAMITHEVRNPLSSIGLNTELLEDELEGAPHEKAARELCRAITNEVDRLTQITEEYLRFARLPKPNIAPESVNTMVGALASFVREDLAAKQVALKLELAGDDPIALVDSAQMRQCLINLVRNAADAVVAKGGGSVTIKTGRDKRVRPSPIEIAVIDDGVGIEPELLPKLFDPFFSTKEGGSGLGLALTQQIVKDHGGDLRVTSAVGRGTTFTVTVPSGG